MLYKGLDIFEVIVAGMGDGIKYISLVDEPAIERGWVCFNKNTPANLIRFNIENEEKHLVSGALLLANTPIYRRDEDGYEYYLTYSPETIKKIAEKMLFEGTFKNTDVMHNNEVFNGMNLLELFIKDDSKGISPNYLNDIPNGSLIGTFHIENPMVWDEIKNGGFLTGFSIEGMFTPVKLKANNNVKKDNKMGKISRFVKKLMKFGQVETDKGSLYFAEDEIAEGVEVFVDGENEEKVIAADGEYVLEDGRIVVVVEGKVSEIREKEVEEEKPAEEEVKVDVEAEDETETEVEVVEPQPEERDVNEERIAALEEKVAELVSKVAELEGVVAQIATKPTVEPIVEEFEKVKENPDLSGLTKGQKKAIERISNAFKK